MLQALVRTKENNINSDKRRGDIICVKLNIYTNDSKTNWGSEERRVHVVLPLEDEHLEEIMMKEMNETGVIPVSVTPYKETESVEIFDDNKKNLLGVFNITKTRSRKYFDIDGIPSDDEGPLDALKYSILRGDSQHIKDTDIQKIFKTKDEETVSKEFEQNKSAFLGSFINA